MSLPLSGDTAPQPAPAAAPAPLPAPAPKRSKLPLVAIAAAVVALIVSGLAFAIFKGYISLPFGKKQPPTLSEVGDSVKDLRSGRFGAEFAIKAAPREPGVEPLDLGELTSLDEKPGDAGSGSAGKQMLAGMLGGLPGDLDLSVAVTTDWSRQAENDNAETVIRGSYSSSGLTAQFDVSLRMVDGRSYVKIDKLPIPFIDLSSIAGLWISSPSELASTAISFGPPKGDDKTRVFASKDEQRKDELPAKKKDLADEAGVLISESLKSGVYEILETDDKAEFGGRPAWRYVLRYDPAKYRETFRRIYQERASRFPGEREFAVFTDDANKNLDDEKYQEVADKITARMRTELLVDKGTLMPAALIVSFVLAPDEKSVPKSKDKQFNVSTKLTLEKANEPITVEAPADALTPKQAGDRMMGRSAEEVLLSDQMRIISDLRRALDAYKEKNGKYPAELSELVGFEINPFVEEEMGEMVLSGMTKEEFMAKFIEKVVNIPNDVYTGQPFVYVSTGASYELKYEMKVPEGTEVFNADEYVTGTNTMTPEDVSVEGGSVDTSVRFFEDIGLGHMESEPAATTDSDGDGLTDQDENAVHHTDPTNADTDGDGFGDGQEVEGGYDPLTNAQTGAKIEL